MSKPSSHIAPRIIVLAFVMSLMPVAIIVQMIRIHFGPGEELRALWRKQAEDFIPIPSLRGDILDVNGKVLATSTVTYTVAIDPLFRGMNDDKLEQITSILGSLTAKEPLHYLKKIREAAPDSRYIVLEKGLGVDAYERLTALGIRGIIIEEQYRRRFNYGTLGAHVLGFVNHNVDGMMGLESYYNSTLKGEDGTQQVRRDRSGKIRAYVGAPKKQPRNGHHLVTTINLYVQSVVEEELAKGVISANADYGTAIVMDPNTGAIIAMANYPTYDPNKPGSELENRRNFAISDMIEPGSTFKLVTAIAARENGVVKDDERFESPADGKKLIYGQWMKDHKPLGTLTFDDLIAQSSNIAIAEVAMRIKPDIFYQYVRNMGFGSPTEVDLPGEEFGRLRKPYDWTKVTLPWMAVGYEIQVTPLQLAAAFSAFANGGKLYRPYIVQRIVNERSNDVRVNEPVMIREICRPATIKQLIPTFEKVVSPNGTAREAMIEGMTIAGKTGTAKKFVDGLYQTRYRSSFIGFFPSRNPRYVTLVILDEPRTQIYGGDVAAPVFKAIGKRILGLDPQLQYQLHGEPSKGSFVAVVPKLSGLKRDEAQQVLHAQGLGVQFEGEGDRVVGQQPAAGQTLSAGDVIRLTLTQKLPTQTAKQAKTDSVIVPAVVGWSMRRAYYSLVEAGYKVTLNGQGQVASQEPQAGARMAKGSTLRLSGSQQLTQPLSAQRGGVR